MSLETISRDLAQHQWKKKCIFFPGKVLKSSVSAQQQRLRRQILDLLAPWKMECKVTNLHSSTEHNKFSFHIF